MAEAGVQAMKLLLIEDDSAYASDLVGALEGLGAEVVVVRSRDSAIEALKGDGLDLIICDLNLPATDDDLGTSRDHGEAVRREAASRAAGTPIIIHSAFSDVPYLEGLLRDARTEDIYGNARPQPLLDAFSKGDSPALLGAVARVRDELRALQDIEILFSHTEPVLENHQRRALAIFARRYGGRRVEVEPLGGGLSGARVLRVRVCNDAGATSADVVAKVDELTAIRDEARRFRHHVQPRLDFRQFPDLADEVVAGAGHVGAIFYSVAGTHDRSLFAVLEEEPEKGDQLVSRVRNIVRLWEEDAPTETLTPADVRRWHVNDDGLSPEAVEVSGDVESRHVQVKRAVQHGDLHGENLLFTSDLSPAVIDFGNVGYFLTGYDAVTLELSLVFHPKGRKLCEGWPSEEEARRWADVEAYTETCPHSDFVRACRTWAREVTPGPRAVLAAAYAYVAKQFSYDDTPKEIAVSLLQGINDAWYL